MAKATVKAKSGIDRGIHDEFPLRSIYSETEPARTYIWEHPNGNYYVWQDCKWVKMLPPHCHPAPEPECNKCCDCVSKEWLEMRLEKFKKEVLSAFIRISKSSCDSSADIEEYVQQEITRINGELDALRNVDITVNNSITDINNNITNLNTVDTETDARLDALEEHDTTNCVTAEDVGEVQEPHS